MKIKRPFNIIRQSFLLSNLILALSLGCVGGEKVQKEEPFFSEWRVKAEKSKGYSPPQKRKSPDLQKRLTEATPKRSIPTEPAEPERPLSNQNITLHLYQTDVSVILRALARAVHQNIMISEGVKGRMDIRVNDAPWDQVFQGILRTQGLTYSWEGDIIRIITLEDKKHIISQLEADRQMNAKRREIQFKDPLLTEIIEIDYANAEDLMKNIEKLLASDKDGNKRGSIMVNKHTNALVVQAIRSDMDKMIPLIHELDRPTAQILIEAHLVEANDEAARELGVQWGGLHHSGDYYITPGSRSDGIFGEKLDEGGIDPTTGIAANFARSFGSGAGLTFGIVAETLGESVLAAQLAALQKEGKLNIISSPSITTIDNQAALIEAGQEIPFQTVEDKEVKIEYKKAVLSLAVTPHVIEGRTLKLNIRTSNDEVDFGNTVEGNPTIITKRAETNVIVFDGQTTVIAGLNKETTVKAKTGVPELMNVPLVGWLFRGTNKSNSLNEFLIFVTPYVLKRQTSQGEQQP